MAKSTLRKPVSEEARPFKHRCGRWAKECKGRTERAVRGAVALGGGTVASSTPDDPANPASADALIGFLVLVANGRVAVTGEPESAGDDRNVDPDLIGFFFPFAVYRPF